MKKLFKVQLKFEEVVVARSEGEAIQIARNNQSEITKFSANVNVLGEMDSQYDLPPNWSPDCFPYGEDKGRAIKDYFDKE